MSIRDTSEAGPTSLPSRPLRYSVAVASVGLALGLKLLLDPVTIQDTPFLLTFGAITVSAWYGGLGPGLLATVLAALITDYFFLYPRGSFSGLSPEAVSLLTFLVEGGLVSFLASSLRSATARANLSVQEARSHATSLRRSEERFRLLVEGVKDYAVFLLDTEGRVASWNAGAERISGYRAEEIVGDHFFRFYTEEDLERDHPEEELRMAVTEGRYEEEGLRLRKDGSRFWANVLTTALKDEEGNLRGFSKVVRDVTEWKKAQEALRQSERRFRALVQNSSDVISVIDAEGTIRYVSPAAERVTGFRPEELVGHNVFDYVRPEELEQAQEIFAEAWSRPGVHPPLEFRTPHKDGSWRQSEYILNNLLDDPSVSGVVVNQRDVTERRRAEQQLNAALERLLTLYEIGRILGSSLKREEIASRLLENMQRVSDISAAVLELQDDRGRWHVLCALGPENLRSWARSTDAVQAARCAALETQEPQSFDLRNSISNQVHLWGMCVPLRVRERLVGVLEAYGARSLAEQETMETLASLVGQAASALENARLYEELAQRERQLHDLVGRMLVAQEEERRRVAYEVHDGLAQIAAAAHQRLQTFAKRHPPDSTQGQERLARGLELIQQTVVEARRVIADLRPTALDDFGLATALRLYAEELCGEGCQVSYEETLGDERLPVEVETALYRVAQEALTNARKHAQSPLIHLRLERLEYRNVRLEVRDWGMGFKPGEVDNGGGPGERVGLSSMEERITLLGGNLEIRSQPGSGTSVVAEIPLPDDEDSGDHER